VDGAPKSFRVRGEGASVEARASAFRRGGIGDGVVCVAFDIETAADVAADDTGLSENIVEAPFGVAVVDGDLTKAPKIVEFNRMFAGVFSVPGKNTVLSAVFGADAVRDLIAASKRKSVAKRPAVAATVAVDVEGEERHFQLFLRPGRRRRGAYGGRRHIIYSVDITDHKRMEDAYAQDQKLKAIGQLAGGVAHDFNNMLQVVLGNCEILMRRHAIGDPDYADLVLIQQSAQAAANLTSKLLAFSRKQTLRTETLNVADVIRDFTPFLHRTLTEKVRLKIEHGRATPSIKADRNQLEVVIMNLAVNARDAMAEGGDLVIRTGRVEPQEAEKLGLGAQTHLVLDVADTGPGVPEDIVDKIFDPYFTTKPVGKGTGLGLATVHGVVGQMGGRIFLDSKPGEGATFRILLPEQFEDEEREDADQQKPDAGKPATSDDDLTGDARILVVEDEEAVRSFVVRALTMCGYKVEECEDGADALDLVRKRPKSFDLVITDVMMPDLDGPGFIVQAGEALGDAKVIFMSGYAEAEAGEALAAVPEARFLKKPFTLKSVAQAVKEALAPAAETEAA
ncbi:MAG: ATP-binding protein, partial [Pseudomonadota bacterium]